jgi:hypothetical protein
VYPHSPIITLISIPPVSLAPYTIALTMELLAIGILLLGVILLIFIAAFYWAVTAEPRTKGTAIEEIMQQEAALRRWEDQQWLSQISHPRKVRN